MPVVVEKVNREAWLGRLAKRTETIIKRETGLVLADYRITCGWPSVSGKTVRIGECWPAKASKDGKHELFISPRLHGLDNKALVDLGGVVIHEQVHVAVGVEHMHKKPFKDAAVAVGLEGKMTATTVGGKLRDELLSILEKFPPYPHGQMDPNTSGRRKQSTRLLKAECPGCEYVIRVTKKWVEEAGLPTCPCGEEFTLV